jgi:hypothetical protein
MKSMIEWKEDLENEGIHMGVADIFLLNKLFEKEYESLKR